MSEVILKGEIHSSKGDLDEEREIVKRGVDVLILEQDDPEMESKYGWFDGWFQWSAILFFWFLETMYRSKMVLDDLADFQGAEIKYTRETNAEMLDNASPWAKGLGASLFYIFLLVAVGLGAASGPTISNLDIYGAGLFLLAVGLPPFISGYTTCGLRPGTVTRSSLTKLLKQQRMIRASSLLLVVPISLASETPCQTT